MIRTRLDAGAPAVVRAAGPDLKIAIDEREITALGATALELVLNGLAATRVAAQPDPAPAPHSEQA
ncbi:hypothetical protein AB0I84_07785 [Streptomyces spectabilis]|uniref:hypothetical protein n=1 Tax=Streptomyces spectabilis TaxID=68270 RepID=UPI0034091841